MFKYLVIAVAIFGSTVAYAQDYEGLPLIEPQPSEKRSFISRIQCNTNTKKVFDLVELKYGEKQMALGTIILSEATTGRLFKAEMVMTVNQNKWSYSVIAIFPDGTACLVANGTDFKPALVSPKEKL